MEHHDFRLDGCLVPKGNVFIWNNAALVQGVADQSGGRPPVRRWRTLRGRYHDPPFKLMAERTSCAYLILHPQQNLCCFGCKCVSEFSRAGATVNFRFAAR